MRETPSAVVTIIVIVFTVTFKYLLSSYPDTRGLILTYRINVSKNIQAICTFAAVLEHLLK